MVTAGGEGGGRRRTVVRWLWLAATVAIAAAGGGGGAVRPIVVGNEKGRGGEGVLHSGSSGVLQPTQAGVTGSCDQVR